MTNEDVNKFEQLLRDAQKKVEEAARMICSVRGAGEIWRKCCDAGEACAAPIHESYKLRDFN